VIRLNPKTATVKISEQHTWLVNYQHLFPVIDSTVYDTNPTQASLFIEQDEE
jgi:hypothetical protein